MVDVVDVMKFESSSSALAIGLGANMPFGHDRPVDTLERVKPLLMDRLAVWAAATEIDTCWSTNIKTAPVGGAQVQPDYWNAVVLVSHVDRPYSLMAALELLDHLQSLEAQFGRNRSIEQRWGPRTLDLDFLFWGEFRCEHPRLVLPHPRMHLRAFVLQPLLEIMRA